MKMSMQGYERVYLWAGTQVVVETGGALLLNKREA